MRNQPKKQLKSKEKHIPMRMCAVTREKLPKTDLVRFVKTEDGVSLDSEGKLKGRGLNMKPGLEILEEAFKRKIFERILKATLTDPEKQDLRKAFESRVEEKKIVRVDSKQLSKLVGKKSG